MTSGLRIGSRDISAATVLAVLAAVLAFVALLAPETVDRGPGNNSSRSTAPTGASIAYELAGRMGWRTSRREAPLESADGRSVQVVLSPQQALGADEVHRALENVRHGGGLLYDAAGGAEFADSLGVVEGALRGLLSQATDTACTDGRSPDFVVRASGLLPPGVHDLKWRRPPPGEVSLITVSGRRGAREIVGLGFPLAAGRIVVMGSEEVFHNYAMRTCVWGADLGVARAFEYLRSSPEDHRSMVFDEFHHGYGAHGGSLTAITRYLAHTASGHFLEQALLASLILLMAYSPRPILPRDPERVSRRSPLEHADALAHAYEDVEGTRTATSRLVGGIRRRVGRTVAVSGAADDVAFLDAVERRTPALAPSVDIVRRALSEPLTPRQFAAVAAAVLDIERQLSTTPPRGS